VQLRPSVYKKALIAQRRNSTTPKIAMQGDFWKIRYKNKEIKKMDEKLRNTCFNY